MSTDVAICPSCGAKNRITAISTGIPHCAKCDGVLLWLVEATDENFAEVTASSLPVLLDLWAPWCPPCRMIEPAVGASADRFAGRRKVAKLNVDKSPRTPHGFEVRGIPTLLILKDGREVERQVVALTGEAFFQCVERSLTKVAA